MYCNGADEHYIDIACPFGKTNSTLEFCPPVKLFTISIAVRWQELKGGTRPRLSSYVDDVYGGIPGCTFYVVAEGLRDFICKTGKELTFVFNEKPHKTPMPAKQQVILGSLYDSVSRRMMSSARKVRKYVARIDAILAGVTVQARDLMSLHGNLCFAANVAPFGKPFLAALSCLTAGRNKHDIVMLDDVSKMGLRI